MNGRLKLFFSPYLSAKKDLFFFVLRISVFTLFGGVTISYLLSKLSALLLARDVEKFEHLIFGLLISMILYYTFAYLIRHTGMPNLRSKMWMFIHRRYISLVCELNNNYAETIGSGRIFSIIDKGGQAWNSALSSIFEQTTKLLIVGIPTITLLIQQSTNIMLIATIILLLGGMIVVALNRKLREHKKARVQAVTEYDRRLIRSIQSRLEITQNLALEQELADLDERNNNYLVPFRKQVGVQILMFQGVRIISYAILAFVYWSLGHEYLAGSVSLETLILLASLVGTFSGLLFDVTELYMNLSDQIISIEQLWTKIDDAPKTKNLFTGEAFSYKSGSIVFHNVNFSYVEGKEILKNFSYTFEAGKRYALVGQSGGGKTTIMKLASGFLSPTSGTVCVDGFNLHTVNLSTFYPEIGYLTQDPGIFDGSIRDNLSYGTSSEKNDEAIKGALRKAQADFVFDLPEGLETQIGERGVKLSGGQKQRLAIAKIFLKDPKIILLDEPTSALDSISEELITKSFETLFEGKTVIIVAHRLKTVEQADKILVVDEGCIAESGNHSELLEKNGSYTRMLKAQTHF